VGFPVDVGRRLPGLRREEVAVLAGVSVDYYVRLEQGRVARPSTPVLEALAAALLLDDAQRAHLHQLVAVPDGRARAAGGARPGLQRLLDSMPTAPAFVLGRRTEVVACNALGAALHGDPLQHPPGERAVVRLLFLDPATRALYPDWEDVARDTVGALRRDAGRHPGDPLLADLVDELTAADDLFRRWWGEQHVHAKSAGSKRFRHPVVGPLTLDYETLTVAGDPDLVVVAYTAAPGGADADALALLGSWATPAVGRGAPAGPPD
jgi:hypothetical protein